jgi:cytochrome P450
MTTSTETPAALFGPADAGARQAAYAALAATGPVHRITLPNGMPAWLVTGYDAVRTALTDPRLVKRSGPTPLSGLLPPDVDAAMNTDLLHSDPPDHTRLRRLVSGAFTRRRVDALAPRIQQIADGLLDELTATLAEHGEADLIAAFAYPLPIAVIEEMLGVPTHDRAGFRRWSTTVASGAAVDPQLWVEAATGLVAFVRDLVAAKRAHPADDLMSALVAARDGADRLTEDELTSMVFLLLVAGHETTVNLIGNGMYTLLTHPERRALLQAEPECLPAAVEELLRFDGPVQVATFRWTSAPVPIGGTVIPAGEIVVPGLLAANRDAAAVPDPAVFDPTRAPGAAAHVAFGYGVHHCLGAPLARLEGRIALGSLLARLPDLRLAVPVAELRWRPSVLMHGLAALPCSVAPREPGAPPRPWKMA